MHIIAIKFGEGINKKNQEFIMRVLKDEKGWEKFLNIKFVNIDNNSQFNEVFTLSIRDSKDILKLCSFKDLSCAIPSDNVIYFNKERWMKGSPHSKQNLKNYRIYLINHEIGHLLGYDHINISRFEKNILCPIMVQQTVGIGHYKPNVWVTKEDLLAPKF